MKIDSKYIEETLKLIFEGICGVFAFFGFMVFLFLTTFMNRDSLVAITSDPEIKAFVEQHMEQHKNDSPEEGKSQIILNFTGKKDEYR